MAGRIVEYRRYEPIPEPIEEIIVEVDETGDVFGLDGAPWFPPEGVRLRTVAIVRRAKSSTES